MVKPSMSRFYHGGIDKKQTEALLKESNEGCFLFRDDLKSKVQDGVILSCVFKKKGNVIHHQVQPSNDGYLLNSKGTGVQTLAELVDFLSEKRTNIKWIMKLTHGVPGLEVDNDDDKDAKSEEENTVDNEAQDDVQERNSSDVNSDVDVLEVEQLPGKLQPQGPWSKTVSTAVEGDSLEKIEAEFNRLSFEVDDADEVTAFYHHTLSEADANVALANGDIGTFLVRDGIIPGQQYIISVVHSPTQAAHHVLEDKNGAFFINGQISTGGASNVADAVEYLSQKQAGWGVPLTMGIPGPRDSLTAADRATAIAELHKREDAVNAAIKQAKKDQMTAYRETQKKNAEQRKQAVLTEFEEISSREKALKSGEAAQLREQFMINKADAEAKKLQDIDNERRKAKVAEKVTNVRRASLKKTREAVDRGLREAEMLADSDEDDPASTQTIKVWCPRGDVDNVPISNDVLVHPYGMNQVTAYGWLTEPPLDEFEGRWLIRRTNKKVVTEFSLDVIVDGKPTSYTVSLARKDDKLGSFSEYLVGGKRTGKTTLSTTILLLLKRYSNWWRSPLASCVTPAVVAQNKNLQNKLIARQKASMKN